MTFDSQRPVVTDGQPTVPVRRAGLARRRSRCAWLGCGYELANAESSRSALGSRSGSRPWPGQACSGGSEPCGEPDRCPRPSYRRG